jgi:arginyl-tRNA synthetase
VEQPPAERFRRNGRAAAFQLAKQLRQAPKKIAAELGGRSVRSGSRRWRWRATGTSISGSTAGCTPGDAAAPTAETAAAGEKIIVEHTNINPNKAAHIGHLRNATLGDTFVRMLRARGERAR